MPVTELRIENYRSIRDLRLSIKPLNVVLGPNGCGKSNLYQAISLIRSAAAGELARSLAREGGFPSSLWAGPRQVGPFRMKLGVSIDEIDYEIQLGMPTPDETSLFSLDPHVKEESIFVRKGKSKTKFLERGKSSCTMRNAEGEKVTYRLALHHEESVFNQISDPQEYPVVDDVRRRILKWRFYHAFRTDALSPIRQPQVGVRTFVLSQDGSDLAAALQTIIENGDGRALHAAIDEAFPGARLIIMPTVPGMLEIAMEFPGLMRELGARELSDGTLQYLCLLAALMSPAPAPLLALNEPETNLNERLLEPLAKRIAAVAGRTQLWLTTHSSVLSEALKASTGVSPILLDKVDGETVRAGRPKGVAYSYEWDG